MMRAISVCSRSTIDFGVPAGNSTPCMVSASWFLIPSSSSVGTSGNAGERVAAVTASARSLPSFTSGVAGGIAWKHIGVCPATTDCIDGPPPGNGASAKSSPKVSLNSSLERCGVVPIPGEAKVYFPGLALMSSTSSFTDLAGMLGCTNRPLGRPGGGAHTEIAASPCHVLDVELLAELFRQLERNEPSHHIGRPRGRERYDDLDRPIGISRALRKCGGGKEKPHADGEHTGVRVGHSHERSPWFSGDAVASGSCTITRSNELLARPNVVRGDDRVQRGQFGDDPYLACAATALNVADTYGS